MAFPFSEPQWMDEENVNPVNSGNYSTIMKKQMQCRRSCKWEKEKLKP